MKEQFYESYPYPCEVISEEDPSPEYVSLMEKRAKEVAADIKKAFDAGKVDLDGKIHEWQ